MDITEVISPNTLIPVSDDKSNEVKESPEQTAICWLRTVLWDLTETRDLKGIYQDCITAKLPLKLSLNGKPIFYSQAAKKQWEDWPDRKFPYPPKSYWEDEKGNPVNFNPGQVLGLCIGFLEGEETACYRMIQEASYSSWEMELIED